MRRPPQPTSSGRAQHPSLLADDRRVSLGRGQEPGGPEEQEAQGLSGGGEGSVAPARQLDGLAEAHGGISVDTELSAHSRELANC